jgi:hypothetical protein
MDIYDIADSDSAHACSEIGQKWSKFGFRILDWEPHRKKLGNPGD